jgi:hypothetical protein
MGLDYAQLTLWHLSLAVMNILSRSQIGFWGGGGGGQKQQKHTVPHNVRL